MMNNVDLGKVNHAISMYISTIIRQRISQNKCTYAAFIGFEKAFDGVDRSLLLYKLLKYNISGNIYWAIKSLY